jgi:hypothetical protein
MSKASSAAIAAVVSAESVDMFQGQPVNSSLVETLEQLGREYWAAEDARSVAEKSLAKCDVSLFDHVKGLKYPDFMFVRKLFVTGCRDKGAETDEAASKVWERSINRIMSSCGFERPKSESEAAKRMAAKRAEQAAKFADKSDGELIDQKADLIAKGDVKSMREATAIAKEIERREKPELDKLQADIKVLHDALKKRAAEWAKAGSVEGLERLTAASLALGLSSGGR